jgi:CRP/FNR family transcriptional regulator
MLATGMTIAHGRATATHRDAPDGWSRDVRIPSFLAALPEAARERLLTEAIRINVPAGALLYSEGDRPHVLVVVNGLVRVFLTSAEGRQVTVRYARGGDVTGLALVFGGPGPMRVQSMTAALVLGLRLETIRALIASDADVARACAEELTRQLYRALDDLSEQAFCSVRQRVIRQLLDLASPEDQGTLVVHASHEELADAVASVRVVVTRILHALRDEGLVRVSRDGIVLVDAIRLADEAAGPA